MHIAVIAAQGRSGRAFVKLALEKGHSIRAGIRGRSLLGEHPRLQCVQCNAENSDDLRELFQNQEAVVSLLGHVKKSQADVQTQAMKNTVEVMHEMGLKRIISLTGTGVRFPGDHVTLMDSFLNFAVGVVDPNRVKDGIDHVKVLQESSLEWTVIRVLKLEHIPARPYQLLQHGPTKVVVGRGEVAQAILEVLTKSSFIRQAPIVSPVTA